MTPEHYKKLLTARRKTELTMLKVGDVEFLTYLEEMFESGDSTDKISGHLIGMMGTEAVEDLVVLLRHEWRSKQRVKLHQGHADELEVYAIHDHNNHARRITVECTQCGETVAVLLDGEGDGI